MRELFHIPEVEAPQDKEGKETEQRPDDPNKDMKARVLATRTRYLERRVKAELALEGELPWHFEDGTAYHCFSFGDVDSITYLRAAIKQQPLEYVLMSTWAMSDSYIDEIRLWLESGLLGRVDFYVGESFQSTNAAKYCSLLELMQRFGGRVALFRNHSKCTVGFGERFDFVVEGSSNANVNPRAECMVVTVDRRLARWYKEEIFDKIRSFNREFDDWQPYKLKRDETV